MSSIKEATVTSLLWKVMERGGNAVVQMAVQVVMARLLAPEQFGALAVMLVFVNLGNVIVQSGLNTALIQSPEADDADFSTVFWMSLAVSVALYAAIFLAAPSVAAFYAMPGIVWPLRALGLLLVVSAYNSVQVAKVTRDLQMRKVFRATMASVIFSAVSGIGAAVAGAGLWALVGAAALLSARQLRCPCVSGGLEAPHGLPRRARPGSSSASGGASSPRGSSNRVTRASPISWWARGFLPPGLAWSPRARSTPQAVGSMLDGAIQPVMLSAVSRVQDDRARVKRLVRRALKTSTFLIAPAMTLFACCAPSLVPALLGPQWAEAVPFMQVYCMVYALLPIHTTNLQALNGMGRSDLFLRLELVKKAYGIAALLFCALVLNDVRALVMSYLVTGVLSTFVNAWPNKRVIGYSYAEQVRDIAPAFLLSGAAALTAGLVGSAGLGAWVTVLAQAGAFVLVYLGLAAALRLEAFTYLLRTARGFVSSRA